VPGAAVVLFDLDGTLVDHDSALREGLIGWLTSKKLATEQQCLDGLVELWDAVAERHFPAFRAREITFQEQRRRRLREFLPYLGVQIEGLDDSALDRVFEDYLELYEAAWRAYADVTPCLAALHALGLRIAVLTNGEQSQQEQKLRRTGLHHYFEVVMSSSLLGAAKPYPEAFRLACARLAAEPEAVTYIGDRLDVDAQAASAAGLRGVWLDRRGSSQGEFAPTVSSLAEVLELVG
jgi:putative hydrolase of the HAD superfamily